MRTRDPHDKGMKIVFNSKALQEVFSKCAQHAKESVLFEVDGQKSYNLTGTGMFSQYSGSIEFKLPEGEDAAPEVFAFGKNALATIANASYFSDELTFEFIADEDGECTRVDLSGTNVKTYLPLSAEAPAKFELKAENKVPLTVNTVALQSAIKETCFASSDSAKREFKDTVCLQIKDIDGKPHLHLCATEGHIIAMADVAIEGAGKTVEAAAKSEQFYIVNSAALQFSGTEEKTKLVLADNMVSVSNGGTVYGLILKEPKTYKSVCKIGNPDGYDYAVQIGKTDLLKALSFIPSGSGKVVRVELKGETVKLTEPKLELENGICLKPLAQSGEADIVFSRDFLASVISSIANASVTIVGKNDDRQAYLQGEDENAMCLVLLVDPRTVTKAEKKKEA